MNEQDENESIVTKRNLYFRKEEGFVYKNTSLLRSFTISRTKDCSKFHFSINGVIIPPTTHTLTTLTWNMAEVRGILSNEYENNDWIRLSQTLGQRSFEAMNHYTKIPSSEFADTVFTKNLKILLVPAEDSVGARKCVIIEGEEEVFKSDAMNERADLV